GGAGRPPVPVGGDGDVGGDGAGVGLVGRPGGHVGDHPHREGVRAQVGGLGGVRPERVLDGGAVGGGLAAGRAVGRQGGGGGDSPVGLGQLQAHGVRAVADRVGAGGRGGAEGAQGAGDDVGGADGRLVHLVGEADPGAGVGVGEDRRGGRREVVGPADLAGR